MTMVWWKNTFNLPLLQLLAISLLLLPFLPLVLPSTLLSFSLLAIGETGRGADLSCLPELKVAVLAAFNHASEEV